MSVEFKVAHTRKAEYLFDPAVIKVKPEMNGRTDLPSIEWLVESMVALGQRVPVEIRNEGGKPVLNSGYSRWRAALEINKKKLVEGKFLLRCVYARCNEQEGFIANLHENLVRNAPTALDDAYNIRRLEAWGRNYEEIAEIYRRRTAKGEPDVKWVRGRLALISLGEEARVALKEGRLKPTAAQAIAKLSEEQQREAVSGGKKVTAPAVRRAHGGVVRPSLSGARQVQQALEAIADKKGSPTGDAVGDLGLRLRRLGWSANEIFYGLAVATGLGDVAFLRRQAENATGGHDKVTLVDPTGRELWDGFLAKLAGMLAGGKSEAAA